MELASEVTPQEFSPRRPAMDSSSQSSVHSVEIQGRSLLTCGAVVRPCRFFRQP